MFMSNQSVALETDLTYIFPEMITQDNRPNYEGYLVHPEHLVSTMLKLRDDFGYDYLSSITGVDYLPDDKMELVYHLRKSTGGSPLVIKAQLPRENPVISSLVAVYAGAEFQEREAWDLMGIKFEGHPDLRRILMWEGFAGHPLRKDWKEPSFEEEGKPFKNRWPAGHYDGNDRKYPLSNNVDFPAGFDPESWVPEPETAIYEGLSKSQRDDEPTGIQTEHVIVNLGPQHPSTHGVFRMAVKLDGETVVDVKPVMGYLHRNHEKIGERNTYLGIIPYTDRLDYFNSMSNNFGYVLAVEKLIGISIPERADYIRIMMAELTRIVNHLALIGFLMNDLGAYFTPFLYAFEERELILDIFEAVSGSRMMCNYFRFGGVARDLPDGILGKVKDLVFDRLSRKIDDLDRYITNNEVIRHRAQGVGVLTPEQAIAYSASGPLLRASGVPYDLRRAQVVRDIPEGPIQEGKPQYLVRVPAGESYGCVEAPKGELGFYIISNGKPNPWRYHVRAPSFINLTPLSTMCIGNKIADMVVILGSIDIVLGETDR
jgi:NADH-quinone oxidoreductase subunit C/D